MRSASIFIRPVPPPKIVLTERDVAVLSAVARYGYLTASHLQLLCFRGTGERGAQRRLRLLWAAGDLDRHFLQWMLTGEPAERSAGRRPLYCLTPKGRGELRARGHDAPARIVAPQSQRAIGRIEHDLVVTDFLVSLESSAPDHVRCVNTESILWQEFRAWRARDASERPALPGALTGLVTDGAFELDVGDEPLGFHLEIVRASVRGGNATLSRRMQEIARLNRLGYFKEVHGHPSLRAVIFLTTSPERALNLATLAKAIPLSRRLFWFGSFSQRIRAGVPETDLLAKDLFAYPFVDGNGETQSLNRVVATPPSRSFERGHQLTDPPAAGHA